MKIFSIILEENNDIIYTQKSIIVYRSKCGHYYTQVWLQLENEKAFPITSKKRVTLKWLEQNYPIIVPHGTKRKG